MLVEASPLKFYTQFMSDAMHGSTLSNLVKENQDLKKNIFIF